MVRFHRLHAPVCAALMTVASLSCIAGPVLAQGGASRSERTRLEQAHPNETYAGYYGKRRGNGAALAAGAVGLAAGAILGGALAN